MVFCVLYDVCASEVSDDIVLQTVELLLRLSSLSAAVKTTSDELLLVSVRLVLAIMCLVGLARFLEPGPKPHFFTRTE